MRVRCEAYLPRMHYLVHPLAGKLSPEVADEVARQVINHFVGSQRMTTQNDMLVSGMFGIVEICAYIFVGHCEPFIPRANDFFLARMGVLSAYSAEGIVGLCVDKVDAFGRKRVTYIIIEGVAVKVSMNARDDDQYGVGLLFCFKKGSVKQNASLRFNFQVFHLLQVHSLQHASIWWRNAKSDCQSTLQTGH